MGSYKRVLLKLSGESLAGKTGSGIDTASLMAYTREIRALQGHKIELAIVLGGGNIFRGLQGTGKGFDRVKGDTMGMLATIINSMALQSALQSEGMACTVLSGIPIDGYCEKMTASRAIDLLSAGEIVIIAGGTGNPFFTTDSAAALRAAEIGAGVILKGTRVDGVYSADPEKDPKAVRYDRLSFDEAYSRNLKIMDLTAFTLCRDNKIPIIVFDIHHPGILHSMLVKGESHGTLVY